jgi:2',3'-cyclic-nucleotide 2'-phosphodiesterase (5'-nucleotidase family)
VRQTTWWPQFRVIDSAEVTPDPDVAAVVAGYEQQLNRELDVPLATTAVELDSRTATVRTGEAAIGNLVADAMHASTRADAAIMNGGGIRAEKIYAPGATITRRDVLAELPFNNRVVVIDVPGTAIRRGLENGFAQWPNTVGRFPQVSGIAIEADTRRPFNRITAIKLAGEPLDDAKTYRIATNDFLARGSRLHRVPRYAAPPPRRRRATARQRCELSEEPWHGAHRRRGADCPAEVKLPTPRPSDKARRLRATGR